MSGPRRDGEQVLAAYRRHISLGRARLAEMSGGVLEVSSNGSRVIDGQGDEYLDCGGYGVFILGHGHPIVTRAVIEQISRHPMSTRLLLEPTVADAAQTLAAVTPPGLDYVHFVNSGAEAVEAAVKLARAHGKRRLISTVGGFHGKTMGALSLTARETYQAPFRPLLPDVHHVPYGDADVLATLLAATDDDACVVVEPVQGEGGVVVPPDGYLRQVQELCRRHGAFFVLDEVQTGLGRLGWWWGADREKVSPDVLLVGKGLSGGVIPVAAMVATADAYGPFNRDPFLHTSTFAGSPVAMAAAAAAVRVIAAENIVDRARCLGEVILRRVRDIMLTHCPHLVADVRGLGLLVGIELRSEELAGELALGLLERHVIINHSLNAHRVIRLTPPAVLTADDLSWLFDSLNAAAHALAEQHP